MKAANANDIIQLRQALAQRFPQVRTWSEQPPQKSRSCWPTGLPSLDALLQGGLPKGALTEVVGPRSAAGTATFLHALVRRSHQTRQFAALIDGHDSFDPGALTNAALSRLLWVRCHSAEEAIKAADIVLRDRNFPLVALDLKTNPNAQLRKISPTAWYRMQRIAAQNGVTLVVLTPLAIGGCADARLNLESRFTLDDLAKEPEALALVLKFELVRWALGGAADATAAQAG